MNSTRDRKTQIGQILPNEQEQGIVAWKSPSNIAIVKYWGKHGEQLPANPSLSLTLTEAFTTTQVEYKPGQGNVAFFFEGRPNPAFATRILDYIQRLTQDHPILAALDFEINSENSFPHSAGIASSASSMSALALCLGSVIYATEGKELDNDFWKLASYNARLGSGSASRSIFGPAMIWGEVDGVSGSSDQFAIEVPTLHPVFKTYRDTILIIDRGEKQIKSSVGHSLMHNHPYAQQRFKRARTQLLNLLPAMKTGDVQLFGQIAEAEAFDLHGMMMASSPPYLLIKPGTVSVIEALQVFRADTGLPVFMTLDAGPNVHLLYPEEIARSVDEWIASELLKFCFEDQIIRDRVGTGSERMR